MDSETVKWISGLIIVNVTAWSIAMGMIKTLLSRAKHTEDKTDEMIHMHNHADDYGFGTVQLKKAMEANARHGRELVYYMRWFVEESTGQKPPPYIDDRH